MVNRFVRISRMRLILFTISFLLLFHLTNIASAYRIIESLPDELPITRITSSHFIRENGDLKSQIGIVIDGGWKEGTEKIARIKLDDIRPRGQEIVDFHAKICEDSVGFGRDAHYKLTFQCGHVLKETNSIEEELVFTPTKNGVQHLILYAEYTIKNFVKNRPGHSRSTKLEIDLKDIKDKYHLQEQHLIENLVMLSSPDDIPMFWPGAQKVTDEKDTLVFVFQGSGDKIIWYRNEDDMWWSQFWNNLVFMIGGALVGAGLGYIITRRDKCKYSQNALQYQPYAAKVGRKVYHKASCLGIGEGLIKQFKDKDSAKRAGYRPCGTCKP